MPKINAYINFTDRKCREAMTFYQQCFGGELSLTVVGESPMADMFPAEHQNSILHADLTGGDFTLLATDLPGPSKVFSSGSIVLTLVCETKAELESMFGKLSDGGNVTHPIMQFYAGSMGNVTDKFGVAWAVFSAEK